MYYKGRSNSSSFLTCLRIRYYVFLICACKQVRSTVEFEPVKFCRLSYPTNSSILSDLPRLLVLHTSDSDCFKRAASERLLHKILNISFLVCFAWSPFYHSCVANSLSIRFCMQDIQKLTMQHRTFSLLILSTGVSELFEHNPYYMHKARCFSNEKTIFKSYVPLNVWIVEHLLRITTKISKDQTYQYPIFLARDWLLSHYHALRTIIFPSSEPFNNFSVVILSGSFSLWNIWTSSSLLRSPSSQLCHSIPHFQHLSIFLFRVLYRSDLATKYFFFWTHFGAYPPVAEISYRIYCCSINYASFYFNLVLPGFEHVPLRLRPSFKTDLFPHVSWKSFLQLCPQRGAGANVPDLYLLPIILCLHSSAESLPFYFPLLIRTITAS